MTIKTVERKEAEQSLPALLDFVSQGNEVVIVENDQVRARLVPSTAPPRTPGLHQGQGWIAEDFDAELPDSFWLGEDEDL
jgi:antitoxin (DNA-binding transcriptional repressor) of toxin-antitoxin stability system